MLREPQELVVGAGADGERAPGRGRVGHDEHVEDRRLHAEEGPGDAIRPAVRPLDHLDVEELVP